MKTVKTKGPLEFDIGDYVVVTHENSTPVMLVVGADKTHLHVVDPFRVLILGNQTAWKLARELWETPSWEQMRRYKLEIAALERQIMARNLHHGLRRIQQCKKKIS